MSVVDEKQTDEKPLQLENIRLLAEVSRLCREREDVDERITELVNANDALQRMLESLTKANESKQLSDDAQIATIPPERQQAAGRRAGELAKANDALTHEIKERQRAEQVARGQTEALTRSLHALAQEPELDRFLGNVLRVLIEQMGEESGSIWLYDSEYEVNLLHTEFYEGGLHRARAIEPHEVNHQWDDEFLPILRSGQMLLHTESDFVTRPAYTIYQNYFAERGIKTILNIPLFFGQGFFGIFAVRSQRIRSFSPLELELAQALAHQAMLAIQITRLADEARQSSVAREEGAALLERNRLAGEIHDGLAQGFTGITVQLGVAERKIARGDIQEARLHLKEALELAKEGLIEARRSVLALRPAALQQYSLPSALARLTERNDNPETCRMHIRTLGQLRPLTPSIEDNFLRIAQEALSNVQRHAVASQVNLELEYAEETIQLRIKDDGKGFSLESSLSGGFGLQSMRERALRMGGQLTIRSSPGSGTEILVVVDTGRQEE